MRTSDEKTSDEKTTLFQGRRQPLMLFGSNVHLDQMQAGVRAGDRLVSVNGRQEHRISGISPCCSFERNNVS